LLNYLLIVIVIVIVVYRILVISLVDLIRKSSSINSDKYYSKHTAYPNKTNDQRFSEIA